jgi:predicted nuclease with TOPRIM domain
LDWGYLFLMVVLAAWSVQMIFEYIRKSDQIRSGIEEAVASEAQVSREAEEAEEELQALRARVEEAEARAAELGRQEKELQERLTDLKRRYAR